MTKITIDNNKKITNSADKAQKSLINIDEAVNDNLLQNLEKNKEPKKEKVTLEIDGQTVEGEKYYFEYPKYIQEETGILGYERTIIPEENFKVFEEYHQDFYERNDFLKYKLLSSISEGEYPDQTFNHVYSWYYEEGDKDRHKTYFKNHKFFLEKIYDSEKIKIEAKHRWYPFSKADRAPGDDVSKNYANVTIYDKNTDKQVSNGDFISLGNVLHYEDEIKEGKVYAATTHAGLPLSFGMFFRNFINLDSIGFGFSFKEPFFKKYLEQSFLHIIKSLSKEGLEKICSGGWNTTLALIILGLIFNKMSKEGIDISFKLPQDPRLGYDGDVWEKINHYIKNEGIEYLASIINSNHLEKEFYKDTVLNEKIIRNIITGPLADEAKMPIFIGHPQIPQLSWGHAKYAHFFSEKGFNFFEFKHAEHIVKPKNPQK